MLDLWTLERSDREKPRSRDGFLDWLVEIRKYRDLPRPSGSPPPGASLKLGRVVAC
jgi:hypothetical protein